jgi:hypothetical protein
MDPDPRYTAQVEAAYKGILPLKLPDKSEECMFLLHMPLNVLSTLLEKREVEPSVAEALSALLAGMLMGTYTALESLATDLWVEVVNRCPQPLADNVLESGRTREMDASEVENKQEAMLPMSWLSEMNYNPRHHMGTVLKKRKKVSFESFKSTELAYAAAFQIRGGKKLRENPELAGIFLKASDDIVVLEAVRNLYAHRGGVTDQKFLDTVERRNPVFPVPERVKPFPIDGEIVCHYVNRAVDFSNSLFGFVDNWLALRPRSAKN